jgi:hypothetical protein
VPKAKKKREKRDTARQAGRVNRVRSPRALNSQEKLRKPGKVVSREGPGPFVMVICHVPLPPHHCDVALQPHLHSSLGLSWIVQREVFTRR